MTYGDPVSDVAADKVRYIEDEQTDQIAEVCICSEYMCEGVQRSVGIVMAYDNFINVNSLINCLFCYVKQVRQDP